MTKLIFVILLAGFSTIALADESVAPPAPKVKKATSAMMKSCTKEFPNVAGKGIDEVDHWAEAQENAAPEVSTEFKKSRCFATHELWERLVQRNEWAVAKPTTPPTRMPASQH